MTASLEVKTGVRRKIAQCATWVMYVLISGVLLVGLFSVTWLTRSLAELLPGVQRTVGFPRMLVWPVTGLVASPLTALGVAVVADSRTGRTLPTIRRAGRLVWRRARALYKTLGARRYASRELIAIFVAACLVAVVFYAVVSWLSTFSIGPGWTSGPDDPRALAISAATPPARFAHGLLTAPLNEEVLFRGPVLITGDALLSGPARRSVKPRARTLILAAMVLVTTAMFGSAHVFASALNVIGALAFGAAAAVLDLRSRSLLPGLLAHALYNDLTEAF